MQTSRTSFVYVAAAYAATAAALKGCGFIIVMWMANALSVAEYSKFGLLFALQSAVVMLATAGLVEAAIGIWAALPPGTGFAQLHGTCNFSFSLLTIPAAVLALCLSVYLVLSGAATPVDLLWVFSSGLMLAFLSLQASLVRLEERHWSSMTYGFAAPLAGLLGAIVAFVMAHSVNAFFAGYAIGLAVAMLLLAALRMGGFTFRADPDMLGKMKATVAPYALIAGIGWLGGYGNTYLVAFFYDSTQVARFAFAYTLSSIMQLVATALNQVWSPVFYRLVRDPAGGAAASRSRRFFRLQGAALGAAGGVLLVALPFALRFGGGNLSNYQSLGLELFFLLAAYSVSIPWWHAQNYFYAFGRGQTLMKVSMAGSLLGFAALALAMWLFGALGVYIGFCLQMLVRSVAAIRSARAQWQVDGMWDAVALSVAILGAATLLSRSIGG